MAHTGPWFMLLIAHDPCILQTKSPKVPKMCWNICNTSCAAALPVCLVPNCTLPCVTMCKVAGTWVCAWLGCQIWVQKGGALNIIIYTRQTCTHAIATRTQFLRPCAGTHGSSCNVHVSQGYALARGQLSHVAWQVCTCCPAYALSMLYPSLATL
jgi:hypothetical protein